MSELLKRFRGKFPQYNGVPDSDLALGIGWKFPDYLSADDDFKSEFAQAAGQRATNLAQHNNKAVIGLIGNSTGTEDATTGSSNPVLDYARQKDPRFNDASDEDLTLYIGAKAPDFLKDPEFKANFQRFIGQRATEAAMQNNRVIMDILNSPVAAEVSSKDEGQSQESHGEAITPEDLSARVKATPIIQNRGPAEKPANDSFPALVGQQLSKAGETLKDVSGAMALQAGGMIYGEDRPGTMAAQQLGMLPPSNEDEGMKPLEAGIRSLPVAGRIASEAAYGLVESAPRLAGVAGLEALGIPAPVGAALVFGSTPEGFSTKDAAIAAAIPYVGKYSGEITSSVAKQFGVSSVSATKMFHAAGGLAGVTAYLGTIQASEIANLPPEQRKEAIINAIASNVGQVALGVLPGVHGAPELANQAEKIAPVAPLTAEALREQAAPEIKKTESPVLPGNESAPKPVEPHDATPTETTAEEPPAIVTQEEGKANEEATLEDKATEPTAPVQPESEGDAQPDLSNAPTNPPEPAEPATILGFGGFRSQESANPEAPNPPATTEPQLDKLKKQFAPGLEIGKDIKQGIQSLLLPSSKSPEHLQAAEVLGSKLGPMNRRAESSATQLKPHSLRFDKLGVHRENLAPADNPGIRFMSDMSQGRPIAEPFKETAELVKRLFDERLEALEKADAPLQTVRENYFPGMWTRESRLAFNAAVEQAIKKGVIAEGSDLNTATPAEKAAVKELVDKFLQDGTTSDTDMLSYLTRRPMAGRESFRKQKAFDDILTGAELGLRPLSNNPIDLVRGKLAELDRSIMAHQYFESLKAAGKLQVIDPYEEVPQGWAKINDRYGTIYGKPTVTVSEHVDKAVYDGLIAAAQKLGISHERLVRFPSGPGNRALGLSYQGQNKILSKFGTETSVIAHEIGHQLDVKYDLWDNLLRTEPKPGVAGKTFRPGRSELRNIADLTERGDNARSKEEKIAQVLEAYIHAPEKMQEVAPRVFDWFDKFIRSKPELAGIAEIKPGLALKKLTGEKYVGLPIVGYRIVPESHGDIINNYLSSSLYNNPYFGKLYKGWMGFANALNQSQLGVGSAFHAGFTTGEAQISAGANVIKDIYGALVGNRPISKVGRSTADAFAATIRTPVIGDKVLNAWRSPHGTIDPRIAQVVRAAELSGGGFKMEAGMMTEQSEKVIRDWYSDHRIRAAARSPVAFTELLAKPIMDWIVPRQKAGVFADLAWRIIEQNPGKALEELTPQFRQAWNRCDARLGQVRFNRLFINNVAKNVAQGLIRAPGWTGGTIAEIGGGFADAGKFLAEWTKTGKPPENIPDRTAYVLSLLTTVAIANGALTYAFTGKQPASLDFLAFRTGNKDENGNDERFLLPTYMKDVLAYASHPVQTLLDKTHPLLSMLNEVLIKNKDFHGEEIRHPGSSLPSQAWQVAKYVVKSFEPFWIRGVEKEAKRGGGPIRTMAPLVGVMPAPSRLNNTRAQNQIMDYVSRKMPVGRRTHDEVARYDIKRESETMLKSPSDYQDARKFLNDAVKSKAITEGQRRYEMGRLTFERDTMNRGHSKAEAQWLWRFKHLSLEEAQHVFELSTPPEQDLFKPELRRKKLRK